MKKITFYSIIALAIFSCKSFVNTTQGATESKLIKTVSIDKNCPVESIKILDKVKNMAHATYALEVCGERVIYQQLGTAFMEKAQAEQTINKLQNPNSN